MNNTIDSAYCRLCAVLKPHKKLVNLQNNEDTCQKVINKLLKFNIMMDFQDNVLPKTVCLPCVECLNEAFAFVTAVEQAQAFLSDFILVHIKPTESDSCEENMIYEPPGDLKDEKGQEGEVPIEVNNDGINLSEKCDSEVITDAYNDNKVTSESISSSHDNDIYFGNTEEIETENVNVNTPSLDIIGENTGTNNECDKPGLTEIVSDVQVNRNSVKDDKSHECMEISDDDDDSDSYFITDAFLDDSVSSKSISSAHDNDDDDDDLYFNNTEELETENTNDECSKPDLPKIVSDLHHVEDNIKSVEAISKKVHKDHSEPPYKQNSRQGKNKLLTTSVFTETNGNKTQITSKKYQENCNIVTKNSEIDEKQIKQTWRDYEWKCSRCETIFPNIEELRSHSMQYHNACNLYQCIDCTSRRSKLNVFMNHVKTHRIYLAHSCYKCFKIFSKRGQAMTHIRRVHDYFEYFCPGCNTPFDSKEELHAHMIKYYNKITTIIPPHLTCGICNKKSGDVKEYKRHLQTHKSIKDWFCETCGKKFSKKGTLKEHIENIHKSLEKSFHCDICGAAFPSKRRIHSHIIIHMRSKTFICDHCGKSFRNKWQLAFHMKLHRAPQRYSCTLCNKKFNYSQNLKQHMLQHTGEKPFSCHICSRDFRNMSNRSKHIRRIHSVEMAKKRSFVMKQQTAPDLTPPGAP